LADGCDVLVFPSPQLATIADNDDAGLPWNVDSLYICTLAVPSWTMTFVPKFDAQLGHFGNVVSLSKKLY